MRGLSAALAFAVALPGAATAEPDLELFAECLADRGAVFYGAHWCPYCARQKEMFGDAADRLPYLECYEDGSRDHKAPDCYRVRSFPTWQTPDGAQHRGVKSLAQLSALTGCTLD